MITVSQALTWRPEVRKNGDACHSHPYYHPNTYSYPDTYCYTNARAYGQVYLP